MPPTTGYSFGDIVLVPFPFTDQSAAKRRPAVVVSSAAYHRGRRDLIIIHAPVKKTPKGKDSRLERRLQQLEKLPPQEKRQALQLLDAFIERGRLKRKAGQAA